MELNERLKNAALRYLEVSGGLTRLHVALKERTRIFPPPKVLKFPVQINILELNEIEADLVSLVLSSPIDAQHIFHDVVHTAAVAISQLLPPENTNLSIPAHDDHCVPDLPKTLPDTSDIESLYPDHEIKSSVKNKCESTSTATYIDKVDFDLAMTSLELDLPIDTAITQNVDEILTAAQIHVPLRVNGIPWGRDWVIGGVRDFPICLDRPVLSLVSGRILSLSLPKSYTVWARYLCSSDECVGKARDLHIRVIKIGDPDINVARNRPRCKVCQSDLEEDPSSRELGEQSQIILLPDAQASALARNTYTRAQALTITLRDEMLVGLVPGQRLQATVLIVPRKILQLPLLEGILVHPPVPRTPHSPLPPTFRKLMADRQSSPWSFVLTLAYMFATTVAPAGTFHSLKLALLLSLASCSSEKAGLATLAVGSNTTLLLRLLWYGSRFAPHSVTHSSLTEVTASFTKDSEGQIWVQAGSLLLAHKGVCVLGDFSKYKNDARFSVCRALESGSVLIDANPRLRPQTPIIKYPLRAAAWACYDPAHTRGKNSADMDHTFLRVPLGDLTKSITDVFGLVIYTETPGGECESQAEDVITLHTLLDAMKSEPKPAPLIQEDELKQYLAVVRNLEIVFSAGAERLIRGYYIAARRLRGDCVQGSAVPVTAIHTLAQAAASHARLALRSTVESWDAVAAILLCEEGLAAHFGYSLLQVPPMPHLSANNKLHTLLGRKNDERMENFQRQLEDFIDIHTGDISQAF